MYTRLARRKWRLPPNATRCTDTLGSLTSVHLTLTCAGHSKVVLAFLVDVFRFLLFPAGRRGADNDAMFALNSSNDRRRPMCSRSRKTCLRQVGLAALSLGMIFVGTCNEEVGSVLVQRLMESSDTELEQPMARLLSLGLGLLFIGKNEQADAMMEVS